MFPWGISLILVVSLLTCVGQLCQKKAALVWQNAQPDRLSSTLIWFALACFCLGLSMLLWLLVLQRLPLSQAYPMLSLNYVWIALAARFIFNEQISAKSWLGIAIITSGVLLMGFGQ